MVVRVAGLPVRQLNTLRFERSFAEISRLADMDAWLCDEAAMLADLMERPIGCQTDAAVRARLIEVRRRLRRVRAPRAADWNERTRRGLPYTLGGRIDAWAAQHRRRGESFAALRTVMQEETERKVDALRCASAENVVRRALLTANPTLSHELEGWLSDGRHRPRWRSILALATYVSRAAAKTSPFSSFMVCGCAVWTHDGPAVRRTSPQPAHLVAELNASYTQAVRDGLTNMPSVRERAEVVVNPSASDSAGGVRFLARAPTESIMTVPCTAALREVLNLTSHGPIPGSVLSRRLVAAIPGTALESAERFLDRLIDLGLLELRIPVPDLSPDALGEIAAWLERSDLRSAARQNGSLAKLVTDVREEIYREVPLDDIERQEKRQHALSERMNALADRLGQPRTVLGKRGGGEFYETAVATRPLAECCWDRWRPVIDDLRIVCAWLSLFDPVLSLRLILGPYVRARFGERASMPFCTLHRAIQEELRGYHVTAGEAAHDLRRLLGQAGGHGGGKPLGPSAAGLVQHPRLHELDQLRQDAQRAILDGCSKGGVIHVDSSVIARHTNAWPAWARPIAPTACYVQASLRGEEIDRVVLNVAHVGHGRGISRVVQLVRQAGATTPPEHHQPDGSRMACAELSGVFGSALNNRVSSTPYEIVYPFTVSGRAGAERIRLGDLLVTHDPVNDSLQLRAPRVEAPLLPAHLGLMASFLLPPAARFLVQAFSPDYLHHPTTPVLPLEAGAFAPVTPQPRVEVGRVVLRRQSWLIPGRELQTLQPMPNHEQWLRAVAFMRRHELPEQVFARAWRPAMFTHRPSALSWALAPSHRPLFLDFRGWFSVAAFQRRLRDEPWILLEEVLPALGDAIDGDGTDAAVSEYLMEVSDREGFDDG